MANSGQHSFSWSSKSVVKTSESKKRGMLQAISKSTGLCLCESECQLPALHELSFFVQDWSLLASFLAACCVVTKTLQQYVTPNNMRGSELLRAFEQLDHEALSAVLLPALSSPNSVDNFSRTCKQLRELCLKSHKQLKLKDLSRLAPEQLAKVPQLFPACTEAVCTATTRDDTSYHLPGVITTLTKLPHLKSLELRTNTAGSSQSQLMALLLEVIRLQLPQIQTLRLQVNGAWAQAMELWTFVGRHANLQQLDVEFAPGVSDPMTIQHLSYLSTLRNLNSLSVKGSFLKHKQYYSVLETLTGLTRLNLHAAYRSTGLASFRKCINLQHLSITPSSPIQENVHGVHNQEDLSILEIPELVGMSHLTQLTHLCLSGNVHKPLSNKQKYLGLGSSKLFLQALEQLQDIKELLVDGLVAASAVPVLAGLTKLTLLSGSWQKELDEQLEPLGDDDDDEAGAVYIPPAIRYVGNSATTVLQLTVRGNMKDIPISIFGNVTNLTCLDSVQAADLRTIAEHCTQLQRLTLGSYRMPCYGMSINSNTDIALEHPSLSLPTHLVKDPVACVKMPEDCATAISSLSKCSSLRFLHFAAKFDSDIPMLNDLKQLRELHLCVPATGSSVTIPGLMRLGYQRHLKVLKVAVPDGRFKLADAKLFLQTVHYVPEVVVASSGRRGSRLGSFGVALDQLKRANLLLPEECHVV